MTRRALGGTSYRFVGEEVFEKTIKGPIDDLIHALKASNPATPRIGHVEEIGIGLEAAQEMDLVLVLRAQVLQGTLVAPIHCNDVIELLEVATSYFTRTIARDVDSCSPRHLDRAGIGMLADVIRGSARRIDDECVGQAFGFHFGLEQAFRHWRSTNVTETYENYFHHSLFLTRTRRGNPAFCAPHCDPTSGVDPASPPISIGVL